MSTKESSVERSIKKWADRYKDEVMYWKLTVPGMSGVPDRICLFRGGRAVFFELKRKGEEPRKLQLWVHKKLQTFGFHVYVFDSKESAVACLEAYLEVAP